MGATANPSNTSRVFRKDLDDANAISPAAVDPVTADALRDLLSVTGASDVTPHRIIRWQAAARVILTQEQ